MSIYRELTNYISFLRYHNDPFHCPHCNIKVLPTQYERHCGDLHDLNPKTHCAWCGGQVSWPAKQKYKYADHLKQCFLKFMNPESIVPVQERPRPTTFTRFNMEYISPEKDFNGRPRLDILPEEAYLPIGQIDLDPLSLTYQDENSNLAAACIKKYLKTVGNMEWFHVMVRATAFQSFLDAINADGGGKTRILPFSCWCDGGAHAYAKYRHHRHMIAFAPNGHFLKNVWEKVFASDTPRKNYKYKFHKGIESTRHLVNTIKYVSQYRSKCKGSFDDEDSSETQRHFHVFKGLPKDIKYILSTLWDGGVLEWITERCQTMSQNVLALNNHVDYREGQYRLRVGDIPRIGLNLVLPVSRCFVPTTSIPTEYFIHLNGGEKMYFAKLDHPLPEDEWFRQQVAGGNLFFHAVAEEWWKPRKCLQKVLQTIKLVVADRDKRIEDLQAENVELKATVARLETMVARLEATVARLETMVETLQIENAQLKAENARLKTAEMENGHLRTEIDLLREISRLKTENGQLKTENGQKDTIIERIQTENDRLQTENDRKDKIIEQIHTENERIQTENDRIQTENDRLQTENDRKDKIIEQMKTERIQSDTCQSKRKFNEMDPS